MVANNTLKTVRILFLVAMANPAGALAAVEAGSCPAGYEPSERDGRRACITPPQLTFRGIEPCKGEHMVLVIDHQAHSDRCVHARTGHAIEPSCLSSFLLETKPGKDRCWREEPRREFSGGFLSD